MDLMSDQIAQPKQIGHFAALFPESPTFVFTVSL